MKEKIKYLTVKITGCEQPVDEDDYWYKDLLGKKFTVYQDTKYEDVWAVKDTKNPIHIIYKHDCKIIE